MNTILKGMLAVGIALLFALPFVAQESLAYHYNSGWQQGHSYGPIYYTGHSSYTYSYGWSGWGYNRIRYSYHYPYRYSSYGHPYAYYNPGWTRTNYAWRSSPASTWYWGGPGYYW